MARSNRAAIYRLIQLVYLPWSVAGYLLMVTKAVFHARRTGESATALASLYTRYMQHQMGTRRDVVAARLMAVLPNVSPAVLRVTSAAPLLGHKLTGFVPRIYRYPYVGDAAVQHESAARTSYIDVALDAVAGPTEQLVILGAGNDTRSYRLPPESGLRCFEVDAPATQALKRRMLDALDVDSSHVTFVSANFLREDWLEKLVDAGFDPDKRSFFVWEGVTMYLDRDAVEGTLHRIASLAVGTTVAFDYVSPATINGRSTLERYARAALVAAGEPMDFGMGGTYPARAEVAAFLAACGLELDVHHLFGPETPGHPPFAGFATAVVPRRGHGRHRG